MEPTEILDTALGRAIRSLPDTLIQDDLTRQYILTVCTSTVNRAATRLLLACLLAKAHNPQIDIRKPYTQLGGGDAFSGRAFDENFIWPFIADNSLPCNRTTAFLTPAFRNREPLTLEAKLITRSPEVYDAVLQVLDAVQKGSIGAADALAEAIRVLVNMRNARLGSLQSRLQELSGFETSLLSAEQIVKLVEQHLDQVGASRLPVLIVAAAYDAVSEFLPERRMGLESHNAADKQTGSVGDVEIQLQSDANVVASYEMKDRQVTVKDIDDALEKVVERGHRVDHYIFVTTKPIERSVVEYASGLFAHTGIDFAVLDVVGFLRHFLHFFHRQRMQWLNAYQSLVLAEPDSAVSHELKELLLVLRKARQNN